ncbi:MULTISPECIES: glutathione S-transferase family protein [Pseudomonas]|uniref:Glutathione S-transferase n=2 Tax=Pseudomonas aeruginosa group TaxID=136841 RepID=A0ABD7K4W8_PSEAI|nr:MULTISPECIES: glutathione S-transferase [Pseudomonas aeruginosa group]KFF35480.1 glutathione S-transferase [Pseudomonas aeruginosa VRFPA01]VTS28520.1 GST-like protein yfcG [Streptococcus dysgalactiae subsp. equisimilis]AVK04946.1 glutathione S-transferase, C-terminal domain protein [Pseudomonas paraeruginosa]AVR67255.1 glutathione S-transferase [Pseudomonas paraeruginosa]AWE94380.1 glutathione S-transferase, C-terminal domain protein [Pseudomonas paraeruginosa]
MKLYDLDLSGNAYKVRLFLALIGREVSLLTVDIANREHKTPAFLRMNPRGQIPVLEDGDLQLGDSQAILVYLARRYASPEWYPLDPASQGRIAHWLSYAANEVQNGPASARLIARFNLPLDGELARRRGLEVLQLVDRHLSGHRWLAQGELPSIADVALYPYLALAPEGGLALDDYPALNAWLARIRALPGYIPMPGL